MSASPARSQADANIARSSRRFGWKMPGVSTRMTWASPIKAMPRTGPRVVWALLVTIETLAPTSALVRVDLPLFGAPISATKPHRVGVSSAGLTPLLAILGHLPDPFAQEHG